MPERNRIYLDHASTTPVLPEARAAMLPWLEAGFGNPSSLHAEGRRAREAIDEAREVVSGAIGSLFAEVLFTSSATEAANTAILGSALAPFDARRRRIVLSAAEHHCVLHTADILRRLGFQVVHAPVDSQARVRLDALAELLTDDVLLVAVMHANNELGTFQPVAEVAELAHRVGARFLCDAVQTFGWVPWKVDDLGADFATISAHKLGGPKGCGALYLRAGVKISPLLVGGGQ
ncbi:MAG: aminotransferase class V-fold PLP-dependent enzyme, partial [Fimbriimonadaceae bacterium]